MSWRIALSLVCTEVPATRCVTRLRGLHSLLNAESAAPWLPPPPNVSLSSSLPSLRLPHSHLRSHGSSQASSASHIPSSLDSSTRPSPQDHSQNGLFLLLLAQPRTPFFPKPCFSLDPSDLALILSLRGGFFFFFFPFYFSETVLMGFLLAPELLLALLLLRMIRNEGWLCSSRAVKVLAR